MPAVTMMAPAARHFVRVHLHRRDAAGDAEADLALPADRLKRDGVVGTAPQHVGADPDADRRVGRRADIGAAESVRAWTIRRKDRPRDGGCRVEADVDTDAANLRVIGLRRTAGRRTEQTLQVGDRADDELL